jgi:D-sedoheptulose 7-phosphate isomerase
MIKTMEEKNYFTNYFNQIREKLDLVEPKQLKAAAKMIHKTHQKGKKIIVVGNGGSAAMASHVSVDLSKAARIRAVNFNESDLITCLANDYGYENWVAKAIEFYADSLDLIILISSSGQSQNILNGAEEGKSKGLPVITFSGFLEKNPLRMLGNINFWVDSSDYNIIEMTHHVWLVSIIDYLIDQKLEK